MHAELPPLAGHEHDLPIGLWPAISLDAPIVEVIVDECHSVSLAICHCGWSGPPHFAQDRDGLFGAHLAAAGDGSQHADRAGHRTAWGG